VKISRAGTGNRRRSDVLSCDDAGTLEEVARGFAPTGGGDHSELRKFSTRRLIDERLDRLVGDPGPVNFGDLRCIDVERRGNVYVAHVSEASPNANGLTRYLEEWLERWGWPVAVGTEW